jgi:hypothetical protein
MNKLVLMLSGVAAIVLALILNPMKFPKEEIITNLVPKVVTKTVYVNVPGKTIVDTKTITKIRVIRASGDSLYTAFLEANNRILHNNNDSLVKDSKAFAAASFKKMEDCVGFAEQLQAEKEALIEDRNTVVDALAEATNQLWQTKTDTPIAPKKLKHGIGASYMILGGSKPIYQLTYEKPLTKNLSVEIGGLWNGKPGISGGIKVRF